MIISVVKRREKTIVVFTCLCSQMVVLMCFGEIPVPIPNTEVKPNSVDDTGHIVAGKVDWCHHL